MKCIILHYQGKPIFLCEIKEVDAVKAIEIKRECENNLQELANQIKEKLNSIDGEIEGVKHDVKYLKGEDD